MPSMKQLDLAILPICTNGGPGGGSGGTNEGPKTPLDKPGEDETIDSKD